MCLHLCGVEGMQKLVGGCTCILLYLVCSALTGVAGCIVSPVCAATEGHFSFGLPAYVSNVISADPSFLKLDSAFTVAV